jgi:hypothetical protein
MSRIDEPALESRMSRAEPPGGAPPLEQRIRALVEGELYGVLCTQGSEQPYGSLVAFAFGPDLAAAVFATPITTRKYQLLSACDRVSLVVDNRPRFEDDMTRIEAVTVTGRALRLEQGATFERWAQRLLERHSYLDAFLAAPTTALFRIDVARFFHVERFQEVRQWIPASPG